MHSTYSDEWEDFQYSGRNLNPIQDEGAKRPSATSFAPITSTNVGISLLNVSDF